VGVGPPDARTLRDEMAVSGQSPLAAGGQILLAAHIDVWRAILPRGRSRRSRRCGAVLAVHGGAWG